MTKASGGDRIPVELFKIVQGDAVKVPHSMGQQIWKTQQWLQDWKWSVFIPIPKKGNAKECSNYCITMLISHATKVMLKIFQAREIPEVQAGFWRAEEPEIKLPTFVGSWRKQENSREISTSASLNTLKLLCGSQQTMENSQRWEYQTTLPVFWETCMQVKTQELEPDMDNRPVQHGKAVCQGCIVTLLI